MASAKIEPNLRLASNLQSHQNNDNSGGQRAVANLKTTNLSKQKRPPKSNIHFLKELLAPTICHDFHQNNCSRGKKCNNFHLCNLYVKSMGNCPNGDSCYFNHDVYDSQCIILLEKLGINTDKTSLDIINELNTNLKQNTLYFNRNIADKLNDGSSKIGIKSNRKLKNKTEKCSRKKSLARANVKGLVFSWELKGNVQTPMICFLGPGTKMKEVEKGCTMLHAKTTFYWQFCVNGEWYNFHAFHSQILENKFRDVNCDSTILPKLNPELVNNSIKDILNLLGYDSIAVDFFSMKITCKTSTKIYAIRQLTTASNALCDIENSTIFNWYFKDNNDSWDLFSDSFMSSEIIEKAYQKDKSSPATFINKSTSFQYTIDFTQMVQINMTTQTKRKIRRRPQPFKEKVKSEDKIIDLPTGWVHMDDNEEYELYDLPSSSNEYKELKDIIFQSLPMECIFKIYRNQNLLMWNQYVNKQKELEKKYAEGSLNIQKLFHAVQLESLPEICKTNLDWRIHDPSTDKPFGQGTYFYSRALDAKKRIPSDGCTFLLAADVIVGRMAKGAPGLTRPPPNADTGFLFDTTTDNLQSPTVFVKYDKQEYYASHFIQIEMEM